MSTLASREAAYPVPARATIWVKSVTTDGSTRTLHLSNGEVIQLHRFASIGKGDRIARFNGKPGEALFVSCLNGEARITPAFSATFSLSGLSQPVHVKEIERDEEIYAYERLSGYHYRNKVGFGRRAILVARLGSGAAARVVGYIEITNTFSGHQARNRLLDSRFDGTNGIHWARWDLQTRNRLLNCIARISRCVVHPEYRGVGLGRILCEGAIKYCQTHWQIANLKPEFLEITADMLKFVPFAERAGMQYIGTTGGNLQRLVKDQTYLQGVRKDIGSGIRETHAVFADDAKSILKRQRRDVNEIQKLGTDLGIDILELLRTYMSARDPGELPPSAYILLHKFLRFPKPTYMIGLTRESNAFLQKRLAELCVGGSRATVSLKVDPLSTALSVKDLTISHRIAVPLATWASTLQEAFGIHHEAVAQTGIRALSFDVRPGEVLYVCGASGSGKTLLLDALRGAIAPTSGAIRVPNGNSIASLNLSFSERPLVLEFEGHTLEDTLHVLNMVGLSEASLYFKSAMHLSNGQRYRLGLAKLMLSKRSVWVVDEFCSILDDNTAELIAWNFARFARDLGVTAVVAGPRKAPVIPALRPDSILFLDSLGDWHWERYAK